MLTKPEKRLVREKIFEFWAKKKTKKHPRVLIFNENRNMIDKHRFYIGHLVGFQKQPFGTHKYLNVPMHRLKIKNGKGEINIEPPGFCFEANTKKISQLKAIKKQIESLQTEHKKIVDSLELFPGRFPALKGKKAKDENP